MNILDVRLCVIISIIVGYLFGSIPIAYLVAKSQGVNIFEAGSGNAGSTNVKRVLGKKFGYLVYALDILKTIVAIVICYLCSKEYLLYRSMVEGGTAYYISDSNVWKLIVIYTGVGVVFGHVFPIWTKFKGGKGISCTLAVIACFNIIYALILLLIYQIVKITSKYVSLGSVVALILLLASSYILILICSTPFNFKLNPFDFEYRGDIVIPILLICLLGLFKHKDNIIRILNGTENKINAPIIDANGAIKRRPYSIRSRKLVK